MSEVFDIYHDESTQDAYWHGIYFVPRSSRGILLDLLKESRQHNDYHHKLSYKDIGKKAKSRHAIPLTAKSWTTIGIAAIQQQKVGRYPPQIYLGMNTWKGRPAKYRTLQSLLGCKLAVFRERDNHRKMALDPLDNIEATFKMALKGALHYLFNYRSPVVVGNIYLDGEDHYIGRHGRTFDGQKILRKLKAEAWDHVSFSPDSRVIPFESDHHKLGVDDDKSHSHLLQLVDLLLGGFRFYSHCPDKGHIRYHISRQCRSLLERERDNFARMKQSRFFQGFSLNEAWLDDDQWCFRPLDLKKGGGSSGLGHSQQTFDFF